MAARRLLILMLVLLAISTLAAALVPPQAEREAAPGRTGTRAERTGPPRERSAPPGRLVEATISADSRKPEAIRLRSGDELALIVRSRRPDQVEIPAFGRVEDVGRDDPARFDLLAEQTGVFEARILEADRVIARIVVRSRRR